MNMNFAQINNQQQTIDTSNVVINMNPLDRGQFLSFPYNQTKQQPQFDLNLTCNSLQSLQSLTYQSQRTRASIDDIIEPVDPKLRRRLALTPGCDATSAVSNNKHLHIQARPSIVGVGGTVTTVTRGERKTALLPRLVSKNGQVNLNVNNIDKRKYIFDLFTTMIDMKWRYTLMIAALAFLISWSFFACVWYFTLYLYDDLNHTHSSNRQQASIQLPNDETDHIVCIENVDSFLAAFLFSVEVQSTLGFGTRSISDKCRLPIVIFCIELIFGVVVQCLIVGMVFAKLSKTNKRSHTIMFSKYATISLRDKKMCLAFRLGDVRSKSHIIGAKISANIVTQNTTLEGELTPFYYKQIDIKIDTTNTDGVLLLWPLIIVHEISETSPFYNMNCEKFANFNFEIVTILEGTVESTGQSIQVRSSYLPNEVKWGFRFEPVIATHGIGRDAQTIIDYNKFNKIFVVDTPTCSASEYYQFLNSSHTDSKKLNIQPSLSATILSTKADNIISRNLYFQNTSTKVSESLPTMSCVTKYLDVPNRKYNNLHNAISKPNSPQTINNTPIVEQAESQIGSQFNYATNERHKVSCNTSPV